MTKTYFVKAMKKKFKAMKKKFKVGDRVCDYMKAKGKIEGVYDNFLVVLFDKGYRQSFTWHKVYLGELKKL
ncbi:MAG: hypothetical protein LIO87_09225 [Eubacterium sp.]|nr:hypothetical protein [Eubacterium sp.]